MAQRILVVDDSSTVRRVVERTLMEAGFEVSLAGDGREGLERAHEVVPDLVLVDFVMPQMNGFQMCQAMRQVANLAGVPVVLMSAKADRIAESFIAQTGALDAISKPFSPEALLAVTTHALAKAAQRDAAPKPGSSPGTNAAGSALASAVLPVARPRSEPPAPITESGEHALRVAREEKAAQQIAAKLGTLVAELAKAQGAFVDPKAVAEALTGGERDGLFRTVAELADLVPSLRGEVAFEGAVEHVALGEIFQLLQHQRQTGVLEVRSGERTIAICMRHGTVDLALARFEDRPEPEFMLGRYLAEEQLVSRDDLDWLLRARTGGRQLLGTQLVKLGYLTAEELSRVLVRQTSELAYEALRWRRGRYRFERFATRPEALSARLGLPMGAILMEGLRRVDEWRLIEEQIRSFDTVLRVDAEAVRAIDDGTLSREERAVLAAVDGERSVRDIVAHTEMSSFDVAKILFQLVTSRLLRAA